MPVILPSPPRRAALKAFSITIGLWAGLAVGVLAPVDPGGKAVGAFLVGCAVAVAGVKRPRETAVLYRIWNKAARGYARVVGTVLLALCYGLLFTAVGRAGSTLRLRRPGSGESLWYAKDTLRPDAFESLDERPHEARPDRLWIMLPTWAVRTGNAWAIFLVPFLMLVSALDRGEQRGYPTGIYTLF